MMRILPLPDWRRIEEENIGEKELGLLSSARFISKSGTSSIEVLKRQRVQECMHVWRRGEEGGENSVQDNRQEDQEAIIFQSSII